MLTIVGLVGAKGAGKSTFSRMLRELRPEAKERALADKLKDVCADVLFIERKYFDDPSFKERYIGALKHRFKRGYDCHHNAALHLIIHDVAQIVDAFGITPTDAVVMKHVGKRLYTPRQVAQYVGTEILRSVDPDVHCKGVMQDASKDGILIVPDVRFPNEMEFFEKLEGKDVRFVLVSIFRTSAEVAASKDTHASEAHLKDLEPYCDFYVDNEGTEEKLREQVEEFARMMLPGGEE